MFVQPDQFESALEKAVAALRSSLAVCKAEGWGDGDHNPLVPFRPFTTKDIFAQIERYPDGVPLKNALLVWAACLIIERVTWTDRKQCEIARGAATRVVSGSGDRICSVSSLVSELIASRDSGARSAIARELTLASEDASDSAIQWALRRHAAARELGIPSLEWLESPLRGMKLEEAAGFVLDATGDVALGSYGSSGGFENAIWLGTAADACEGWPAVLSLRWFQDLFGGWKTLASVRVELGSICRPLCGASFARALARFGAAVFLGCARRTGAPFSIVDRPFDIGSSSYGALFASLLCSIPFLKRRLGLGAVSATAQARLLARSLLVSLRLCAVQASVASACSREALVGMHVSRTESALFASVPAETAGVLPRYTPLAGVRLCGSLRAAALQNELVDRFDEDWFDNPRAHEYLLSIDVSDRVLLDDSAVGVGVTAMQKYFSALLLR